MIGPCRRCGRDHGAPPFRFASAAPDAIAALPEAERERRAVVGDDNAALGDAAWFLRGALALPHVNGGLAIVYRAWCAVDRRSYKRALALWRDPRRLDEPPIAATLASSLPGLAAAGAVVELAPRPSGEALEIRVRDGALATLMARGLDDDATAELVAAALHGG